MRSDCRFENVGLKIVGSSRHTLVNLSLNMTPKLYDSRQSQAKEMSFLDNKDESSIGARDSFLKFKDFIFNNYIYTMYKL